MPPSRSKKGKSAPRCRAGSGPCWCKCSRSSLSKSARWNKSPASSSRSWRLARAKAEVFDVYDKIEDARAEGKTLAEAAANLKLEARTIEAIDRSGRDPAGAPVKLPDAQRLLPMAFTTDVGVERDPLQFQDGYIWFDVVGITPSRERPLDEVKEQVELRWRDQEIATRLNAKATEIVDKLKGGATLADVATADHLKLETLTGLKRGDASGPLSAAAVDAVFRTAQGRSRRS